MAMYAFRHTSSTLLTSSSTASPPLDPLVFSVPPPSSCAACGSCGNPLLPSVGGGGGGASEEDRTFALQLRAAAVFHKMDVPPPPTATPAAAPVEPLHPHHHPHPLPLNAPPPPTALSYPPPALPFTRYPPPAFGPGEGVGVSSSLEALGGDARGVVLSPNGPYSPLTPPPFPSCETSSPSGMKRMSDMETEETPVKRARPAGDTELRLLIQSKAAGSIIGKGGQNISRLRSENPANITVPDCPGPERVLSIGGSEEVAMKVLEEVLESLDEKDGGDSDIRILVHHSQAGCIIGKGGSKIKELRELCGGQVKVYTNCCPQSTDRVIQIIGDRQRVLLTISNVLESLRDSPIKGVNNSYNPHNFDEFYAQEYGGWSEAPKGRFPPMGRAPLPMGPGGPIGRGPMGPGGPLGPPGPPPPFNRRGPPFPSRGGSMPPSMHSPNGDYDGGMRQGKPFMNGGSPHNGDHNTTTQQVTIPKEVAGAIIGKGGARIRKIRADSGASISIEDSRPGSNERIITITGSESQIKHAQYLLQQSVREFGGQPSTGSRRF